LPGEHSIKLTPVAGAERLADAAAKIASDSSLRESVAADLAPGRADQTWVVTIKSVTDAGRLEMNAQMVESSGAHAWNPMIQDFPQPLAEGPLQKWMTEALSRQPVVGGKSGAQARSVADAPFGLTTSQVGNIGLFAGAAIAAACFAVFALNVQRSAGAYRSIAQVESFKASQLADQGKTFAIAADISWIASALFLGAGLALWFLPNSFKKGEPPPNTISEPAQPLLPAEETPETEPAPAVKPVSEKAGEPPPKPVRKKTAAEERAEAKRLRAQERAERKRRLEEERAERRRQAEEEKASATPDTEKLEEETPAPSSGDSTVAAKRRTTEELKGKKSETDPAEPRPYDDAKPRGTASEAEAAPAAYQDDSASENSSAGEDLKNY
jgi:outer membrane biosynthesis protein TonB